MANWDALVVIAVFVGGVIAAGAATAAALRLRGLGLAGLAALSAWLVFALAYAMPFGWSASVGDGALVAVVLLLAIVGLVPRGPLPQLAIQPFDVAALAVVLLGLAVPAVVLPVPLDTDAQGFGYLALTAIRGGDLTSLAPFQPEVNYLYAPGFTVTVAYISERLGTPLHTTQFGVGAGLAWLFVLAAYDFGVLLGGRVRARAHLLAAFIGTGLLTTYMDSHYTSLYGLALGTAFLAWVYTLFAPPITDPRPLPERALLAALALAALVLVHPDTTIIIGLGFGAWLLLSPAAIPRPAPRAWLTAALGVPLAALVPLLPWLWSVRDLLGGGITSPFERDPAYWRIALSYPPELLYHGGAVVLVSLAGAVVGLRRRSHAALLALGWLALVLEFAAFGLLEQSVPWLVAPVLRYDYPFSIAWHGPILPYILLAGLALAALWHWIYYRLTYYDPTAIEPKPPVAAFNLGYAALLVIATGLLLGGVFNRELLAASKGRVMFFGAFASHADVAAMTWLRENTSPDAYILNFPGPQEGDWVPVISERRSVYYRPQPFFDVDGDPLAETAEQRALRAVWERPAAAENGVLILQTGIDYVIVPQVVGDPSSFFDQYRWRAPFSEDFEMQGSFRDARWLTLVYEADGAAVYRVGVSRAGGRLTG